MSADSLTFLSLSRPSLAYQSPLPTANTKISPKASLSHPFTEADPQFILTPNVTNPSTSYQLEPPLADCQ